MIAAAAFYSTCSLDSQIIGTGHTNEFNHHLLLTAIIGKVSERYFLKTAIVGNFLVDL